jgi:hypothetical protein
VCADEVEADRSDLLGFLGMSTPPARTLLCLWAMALAMAPSACVIPADGQSPPDPHSIPPHIDPQSLTPSNAYSSVELFTDTNMTDCRFAVAATVTDRDSPALLFRWVVDNDTTLVSPLSTGYLPLPNNTHHQDVSLRLDPSRDFVAAGDHYPHVLSLFVTDASAWKINDDRFTRTSSRTDLGRIITQQDDTGIGYESVVEVRWTFTVDGVTCQP